MADRLTDTGFSARPPSQGQPVTQALPDPTLSVSGVTQHRYTATVSITDLSMGLLPVYPRPTRIQRLDSSWFYDNSSGLVYSPRSSSTGKQYSFDYLHTDYNPGALRNAKALPADDPIQKLDTEVPAQPFVSTQVDKLIAGKTTPYDKVLAIYTYFSSANGFKYALSTKTGSSGSDIEDFLTNKQGYCEQYAAAMAWMVRTAHIPARVAFGFTSAPATRARRTR